LSSVYHFSPLPLDSREALSLHAWRAFLGFGPFVGRGPKVLAVNLVVQLVKAIVRFSLAIPLPLKRPDLLRCFQAHPQSPHLGFFGNAPEVRDLPSTGLTGLRRRYDPLRLPAEPLYFHSSN